MKEYTNKIKNIAARPFLRSLIIFNLIFLISISSLNAGPFLKIDRIDADSEFPKIRVFLTVKNFNNKIITGLNEENILLYEDGFRVNYVRVKNLSETEGFLYLVFSIDSSKSISKELLKQIKNSANTFLSYTNTNDMVALYRFNDEIILLNSFTNNRAELLRNIKKIDRHGKKTLLFNAIYDSIDLLNKTDIPRKAVIIFTDGKDEGSSIEINDIIDFAKDTHIPIYCITFNPENRIKMLSRLTKLTGGRLFNSKQTNINDIYRTILTMIKRQYLLEYQSMLKPDGKKHLMEVRLKYENLRDREQKKISIKKSISFIHFPSISEIILISLVLILLTLLIIALLFTYKKINKTIKPTPAAHYYPAPQNNDHSQNISENNKEDESEKQKKKEDERIYTKAWLVERDGPNAGNKIPIPYDEITFGRNDNNYIILDDKSVSGKHSKIKIIKKSFYLFDLATDKGTFLNGNKLLRPKMLYDWDEVRIGKKIFIFRGSNIA